MRNYLFAFVAWSLLACTPKGNERRALTGTEQLSLEYARGFKVTYDKGVKWVEVTYPYQGATSGYRYLLVPRNARVPEHADDIKVIRTPVDKIVCTSTTHIPLLDYLGETGKLVGFPSMHYISSTAMRKRIEEGKVKELGMDKDINLEQLAVLQPDVVMSYSVSGDEGQFKKIAALHIPVVINAEYLEQHPLGRAEWIKFMAVFFDKEKEADSVFRRIQNSYLETKLKASESTLRPTVLSGILYGDGWFLPGGKNYAATLLRDAQAHYVYEDNDSNGFLELSFEAVYEKAHGADFWIGVANYNTLKELAAANHRYTKFKAFQSGSVYSYTARVTRGGGNEYLELGYLRPDIILKDLVKIIHPELLLDHDLYFYKRLH